MSMKDNNSDKQNEKPVAQQNSANVENSNDERIDQDFPGYPHYPSKEDIMDQRTDSHRVDVEVENLAGGQNGSGLNERYIKNIEHNDTSNEQDSRIENPNSSENK